MAEENAWLPTVKNIEDYKLLKDILHSQRIEFDILSKKKTDGQLNPMKIKMVNRVLEPLKELFKQEQSHMFLDTLNEDEMPTYSDVVLIVSQYETAISEFKGKYYAKDKYLYEHRWMTQELPFDYYAAEENEKNYEDEE